MTPGDSKAHLDGFEYPPVTRDMLMSYLKALVQLDMDNDLPMTLEDAGEAFADVHILRDALDVFKRYVEQAVTP